ncbi:histidine phosphatase family protein [Staphylococcus sp. KG4-3]|uniref:Histidine phosphatase family protein n=1 Tax=Staphylococcus xylosus TaxID=1288 RepID=A0A418IRF7_STAXY|nr:MULTISPECIES: histidine phosphatase family protein [Staphylococcus]MBF0813821.1 histidine phosphatase family protein [Staphylococcus saprophyticus]MDW8543714.1 histidine phosphatase family protein [Staphylococcus sp. KG4-1]MDW8563148.1 histidine phosphatase family protein [Staphylococcus sp. KG4-3]RIN12474.1 histidine phosphatase family protein [Staphylococcus xylosus]TFV23766.1 histidine phosphatase family protein [Staphylococcus saprophyticus]
MTKICFIRHGETDWNIAGRLQGLTNTPLNEKGIEQAKACGQHLKESHWDVILTSPLSRAKTTAQWIQHYLNIPLIENDAFIEVSFGDAEGLTPEERSAKFPSLIYPNKEKEAVIKDRFLKGIDLVNNTYKDKNILIISHGAFINAIFHHYSNGNLGTGITKLTNGSISTLKITDGHYTIINYDQTSHLPMQSSGI